MKILLWDRLRTERRPDGTEVQIWRAKSYTGLWLTVEVLEIRAPDIVDPELLADLRDAFLEPDEPDIIDVEGA